VVIVGKGKILDNGVLCPLEVKVGDKVLFGKYAGNEIKISDEKLLVMRESDIMLFSKLNYLFMFFIHT
jgi:chaperonin GroES